MLVLTNSATAVVRSIAERRELSDDAGLRVTGATEGPGSFSISAVSEPEDGDQIIEQDGARVFLDPGAAIALDDKVLDAHVNTSGNVEFLLGVQ